MKGSEMMNKKRNTFICIANNKKMNTSLYERKFEKGENDCSRCTSTSSQFSLTFSGVGIVRGLGFVRLKGLTSKVRETMKIH